MDTLSQATEDNEIRASFSNQMLHTIKPDSSKVNLNLKIDL